MRARDAILAAVRDHSIRIGHLSRSDLLYLDDQTRLFSTDFRNKYNGLPAEVRLSATDILSDDWYLMKDGKIIGSHWPIPQ